MKKHNQFNKILKFSIRKFKIGAVPVAIGSLLLGMPVVSDNNLAQAMSNTESRESNIKFKYVSDSELTDNEKNLIKSGVPTSKNEKTYYLVYKKENLDGGILPKTGQSDLGLVGLLGTALFVVAAVTITKNGRKKISKIIIITALGQSFIFSGSAFAVQNELLKNYNQNISIGDENDFSRAIINIDGYKYIGYFSQNDLEGKDTYISKPEEPKQPETSETKPEEPKQPETPEIKPEEPKQPETPEIKPEEPKQPETPEIKPEEPKQPETPEIKPEEPKQPETPEIKPEDPKQPETPETKPEEPKQPETPETKPEDPKQPETPEIKPEDPKQPETPETKPEEPKQPETPETKPEEPKQPETQLEEKGSGVVAEDKPKLEIAEKELDYTVREEENADLEKGIRRVKQKGVKGKKEIVTEIVYQKGVEVSRTVISEKEILAIEEIIEVGTKEKQPEVDKTGLENALTQAGTKNKVDYSEASYAKLEEEKAKAEEIKNKTNATQSEVDKATRELEEALQGLGVDKTGLESKLEQANEKASEDYSEESYAKLQKAKEKANEIKNKTNATQSEVDKVTRELEEALQGLGVDKTELHNTIEKVSELQKDKYTEASWQTLQQQLEKAKEVKNKENATQSEVNESNRKLQEIIDALQVLKQKPQLTVTNVEKNEEIKQAKINYNLKDKDGAYVDSKIKLLKSGEIVGEYSIVELAALLENLDYNTPYVLETYMSYDLGNGKIEEKVATENIELTLKKVEFKNVSNVELYDKNNVRIISLSEVPKDLNSYYAKVRLSNLKDIIVPISKADVTEKNGHSLMKMTVELPELVHQSNDFYEKNYEFYVEKSMVVDDAYTSFKKLVDAMNADPAGTYKIGSNMTASEINLAPSEKTYVKGNFTGSLLGLNDQPFAIYGLKAPLFSKLVGATIKDVALNNVKITDDVNVGALAKEADRATIKDVAVKGDIVGKTNVGGLIGDSKNSNFENVAFIGNILSTHDNIYSKNSVGGITGALAIGKINKAKVDANIEFKGTWGYHRGGLIAGQAAGNNWTDINNVYVKGTITNKGNNGQTGGIVGSTYVNGRITNAVTEAVVKNGNIVHGDSGYKNNMIKNVFAIEDRASGNNDMWTSMKPQSEAQQLIDNLGINVKADEIVDVLATINQTTTDYSSVKDYNVDKKVNYENIEKLIPFYNKEYIVERGNKVAEGSKLNTTKILAVTPMKDNKIIANLENDKQNINKIMIHYADGSIEYMSVNYVEDFKNTKIAEYRIEGTELIYTPEQFISNFSEAVTEVSPVLTGVDYNSDDIWNTLGGGANKDSQLEKLYLRDSFNNIKDNIASVLNSVISTSDVYATQGSLVNHIKQNKEKLLLGLAYVNRWYNIDFGEKNIKDLILYYQNFSGNKVNTLDWLIEVGSKKYAGLSSRTTDTNHKLIMAKNSATEDLPEFLEKYRTLFAQNQTANEWFKSASKAYMPSTTSDLGTEVVTTDIYPKLLGKYTKNGKTFEYKNMLLPLLTMSDEGVYIIPTISSITFGQFDKYIDMSLKESNPAEYEKQVTEFKKVIDREARNQGNHFAAWYRIANDNVKDRLLTGLPVWDTFESKQFKAWSNENGDKSTLANREFFGPVGRYHGKPNRSEAYADGSSVVFVELGALEGNKGPSVFTHEFVHNFDSSIYLGGFGRREGWHAEDFPEGILQSPRTDIMRLANKMALNLYFNTNETGGMNEYNSSPSRFQNSADVKQYMHGVMDVLYMLDYAQAKSIAKLSKEYQKVILRKLEAVANGNSNLDNIRDFTDEEWDALNLQEINDFIDNGIVVIAQDSAYRNSYGKRNPRPGDYNTNVPMFIPFYNLLESSTGSSGQYTLRRTAFELLADQGYNDGFLAYTSNKFKESAKAAGRTLSDSYIREQVFGDKYASMNDFKKAMFKERIDKLANLEAVSDVKVKSSWKGINFNKTYNFTNFEEIQAAMDEVVRIEAKDFKDHLKYGGSQSLLMFNFKKAVFEAYKKQTDEFRTSIFND